MADRDELIDTDGENLAVRWFLAAYGGGVNTIHRMAIHMQQCGFGWTHPDWVIPHTPGETLTKGGAQSWLRHLFSLEAVPVAGNGEAVAQMSGDAPAGYRLIDHDEIQSVLDDMLRGVTSDASRHTVREWLADACVVASHPSNAVQDAVRSCAIKYLTWLGVKNPEKALERDLSNPEMLKAAGTVPQVQAPSELTDEFLRTAIAFAEAHIDCDVVDGMGELASDEEAESVDAEYNRTKAAMIEAYRLTQVSGSSDAARLQPVAQVSMSEQIINMFEDIASTQNDAGRHAILSAAKHVRALLTTASNAGEAKQGEE